MQDSAWKTFLSWLWDMTSGTAFPSSRSSIPKLSENKSAKGFCFVEISMEYKNAKPLGIAILAEKLVWWNRRKMYLNRDDLTSGMWFYQQKIYLNQPSVLYSAKTIFYQLYSQSNNFKQMHKELKTIRWLA